MAGGRVSVFLLAALALVTAGSPWAAAQGSIALPNIIDPKIKLPTILPPKEGPVTVSLPDLGLPGISLLNTVNLPPNLGLPKGDPLLLVNLPGISIVVPNVPQLARLGSGVIGTVLTGVFATRSPDRPNPLGLHTVTIRSIDGSRLRIGPIEALDGTPVVDVKPSLG